MKAVSAPCRSLALLSSLTISLCLYFVADNTLIPSISLLCVFVDVLLLATMAVSKHILNFQSFPPSDVTISPV